jgi:hypothetical protein
MYDNHLLRNALKRYCEFRRLMEHYNYLLKVRQYHSTQIYSIFNTYVKAGAPQQINIAHATRAAVTAEIDTIINGNADGNHATRLHKNAHQKLFDDATSEVLMTMATDHLAHNVVDTFWRSPIFLKVHKWRLKYMWRIWKTNGSIPTDKLTAAGLEEEIANSSNNASPDIVSPEEMADFLTFLT